MYKVITVVCITQVYNSTKSQVAITEHEHPQIKAALEEGYHVVSITPTFVGEGKYVTLTFVLQKSAY